MNSEKYKVLSIATDGMLNGEAPDLLEAFNSRFSADDLYVTHDANTLDVWLRQVNMNALVEIAGEVGTEFDQHILMNEVVAMVKSIKSYGINGKKRLYVGYNAERKVANRKQKEQDRGKHYYTAGHGFTPESNAMPGDYLDRVICGDSEEVLKHLPDNSVDLVFTSPPYNFGLGYEETPDADYWEAYFDKLFRVFDQCIRVLKYGGRIVVNIQPLFSDYIPSHHIVSNYFMDRKLIWKGEILWEKNNYNCKYTAWGSWKSPASPYLKYTWEFLEVFCKGDLKKDGRSQNADIDADSFKKWVTAKWSIAPERNMSTWGHPAMFPEELAKRVQLLFSFRGDTILDPFNGVGTTSAVAQQNGRRFLGVDISPEYCSIAQSRLDGTQIRGI